MCLCRPDLLDSYKGERRPQKSLTISFPFSPLSHLHLLVHLNIHLVTASSLMSLQLPLICNPKFSWRTAICNYPEFLLLAFLFLSFFFFILSLCVCAFASSDALIFSNMFVFLLIYFKSGGLIIFIIQSFLRLFLS